MMRDYRQLNKLMTDMREIIRFTYDKGYNQAKKEFQRGKAHWVTVTGHRSYIEYKCSNCGNLTSGKHLFCPNCGYDTRKETEE